MADIARLGFSADTNDLKDAKASLDALVPSAQKAEKATERFNAAASGLGGGTKVATTAAGRLQTALNSIATTGKTSQSALLATSTAMGTVKAAAAGANTSIGNLVPTVARVGNTFAQADAHVEAYKRSLAGVVPAANNAGSALNRLGAHANDNINRLQATPGNVAAQFQDIGVTAAAGMSPMIIALQQGTQLTAAMSGGLGNLIDGLKQVFTPTAILTIGLVGLIAAGIQMVDWISVAQTALYGLADIIELASVQIAAFGAAILLLKLPAIITGIVALTKAMWGLVVSLYAAIGLPVLLIAGFIAIATAAVAWRDELTEMLGVDIVGAAETGINYIIAFFVGGYNAIKATWSQLPGAIGDLAIQAANATISAIESMIDGAISRINALTAMLPFGAGEGLQMGGVSFGRINNRWAGQAGAVQQTWGDETRAAAERASRGEFTEGIVNGVTNAFSSLADWLRGIAGGLGAGADEDAAGKTKTGRTARTGRPEPTNEELFAEVLAGANDQTRALAQAGMQIGVYGEELARMKYEQQLLNDAQDRGVVLTEEMNRVLMGRAAIMAAQETANARNAFMEGITRDHSEAMSALEEQRTELGLTGAALESYRYEMDLLADARRQNIELGPEELEQIRRQAEEYGVVTEAIREQREMIEIQRDAFQGLFMGMINGLRQGESVWETFGNTVTRVVDRIIDRLLTMNGGLLDQLFSLTSAFIGGATGMPSGAPGTGMPALYAKGGTFTNGVYDSPTLFKFASGGSFGVMGEAGPEAVMPLKRGPDGSLGVQVHNDRRATSSDESEVIIRLGPGLEAEWLQKSAGQTVQILGATAPGMLRAASSKTRRDAARPITPGGRTG